MNSTMTPEAQAARAQQQLQYKWAWLFLTTELIMLTERSVARLKLEGHSINVTGNPAGVFGFKITNQATDEATKVGWEAGTLVARRPNKESRAFMTAQHGEVMTFREGEVSDIASLLIEYAIA